MFIPYWRTQRAWFMPDPYRSQCPFVLMLELASHVDLLLLLKQEFATKQNRENGKELIDYRLYVIRAQYNVTCKLCSGGEGRGVIVYHYGESVKGLRGGSLPYGGSNLFKAQSTYKALLPPSQNIRCSPILTLPH